MCGIVGIRRFDNRPVAEGLLRTMTGLLQHRGPDDEGFWTSGAVGLGHRRLSIIDVAGSAQPMSSVDGRCHVSFNGEIFNYRALRDRLSYPFRTDGDTEVLLALYQSGGAQAVEQLQGQFSYALFDEECQQLLLFRDRLGILPLYYYIDTHMLVFASEIKALVPALTRPLEVDEQSLGDYLSQRSVPAPHTLFRSVRKLSQGHFLRVGPNGNGEPERYWSIPPYRRWDVSDVAAVSMVADALERSVQGALVADVPVGAFLSGGVDSSLIVALMSKIRGGSGVETFSAGFGDSRNDELPFARAVSELLRTDHHEVTVTAEDFQRLWPRLTWHRDAPISEPADIAVFKLASVARESVKVVLSGEGSDELFAGYPKYRLARWAAAADILPPTIRDHFFDTLQRLLPAKANRPRVVFRAMSARNEAERLQTWFAPFTGRERVALLGHDNGHGQPDVLRLAGTEGGLIRRMLYVDCHAWLADNLLERGDRMSMAASLEMRPPFLDHALVELAFSLPSQMKLRRGRTKWAVKEVALRFLPREIVERRKVGFRVPLDAWFRGGLRDMAHDVLLSPDSLVSSVMEPKAVRSLLASHNTGRRNEEARIWTLLSLEVWHQVFFRPTSTVVSQSATQSRPPASSSE